MHHLARRFTALAIGVLLAECRVEAQSSAPILRIETGMHSSGVRRIATDATGRLVLTCGDDKTAMLWSQPKQSDRQVRVGPSLVRTFRVPIDQEDMGVLYACALSPDGKVAAVGGITGKIESKNHPIYLFDTSSGRLLRQMENLPDMTSDLAFSPNGKYLAAALGHDSDIGYGLRIFDAASGAVIAQDTAYSGGANGVDWNDDDALVTTCDDGKVRLYDIKLSGVHVLPLNLQPSHATLLKKDLKPFTARFSPEGLRIAVGFTNSSSVAVLSAVNLRPLYYPDCADVDDALFSLAWIQHANGKVSLAAGGGWARKSDGRKCIRIWADGGRGKPSDFAAASDWISDIRSLKDEGLLFTSLDPAWGIALNPPDDQADLPLFQFRPHLAGFHDRYNDLNVSADGSEVAFAFQMEGTGKAHFSLRERRLDVEELHGEKTRARTGRTAGAAALHAPRLTGINITGWKEGLAPKVDGAPLNPVMLFDGEASHCMAVTSDASCFAIGSDFWLNLYNNKGQLFWTQPIVHAVHAVNFSADDKLLVAAHGDGTIRWHNEVGGQELLALFPDLESGRWVLWTPEGYYDCSPGAEDLIGWHVNRSRGQAADFFPVARFRAIYYRPDVIQRVLPALNVFKAVGQADAELGRSTNQSAQIASVIDELSPPVVDLETGGVLHEVILPTNAASLDLSYRVRQTGLQKPTQMHIRANGRPLAVDAPVPAKDGAAKVSVPLPQGFEGEIAIIASHALARSEAATLRVRRSAPPPTLAAPKLFVLSVGVADLAMNQTPLLAANIPPSVAKEHFQNLEFAADDARKVGAILAAQQGKSFREVESKVLVNGEATTAALRQALKNLAGKAEAGDVVFVFFSGHGNNDPATGKFHLVTHDTDPKHEADTALSGEELSELLGEMRGYVVAALDACHSGSVLGMQLGAKYKAPPLDISGLANQLSSAEHGIVMLSSSTPDEVSVEDRELGSGLFTKALLEGLAGKAADKDGLISCQGLMRWIDRRVPELAGSDVSQNPVTVMPRGVPDFMISRP